VSDPIVVEVIGEPIPQGSMRAMLNRHTGQPFLINDNDRTKTWRRQVKASAKAVMAAREQRPIAGPVTVDLTFRLTRPRTIQDRVYPCVPPDVDKLTRAVLDACSKTLYADDGLVVGLVARKLYAYRQEAGVTITVKEVS